jgi:hypothetical protein
MKLFCTLILGLVIKFTFAQVTDEFGGNSVFPVPWEGQTNDFLIQNEELRLNSSGTGNSTIYLPSSFFYYSETEIRLKIRIPFSPSANNRLNLFIYSDSVNVLEATNGLYLQFGESGSNDALALRGIFNGLDVELVRGLDGRVASSFELEIKITHSDSLFKVDLWADSIQAFLNEITYIDTNNFFLNNLALDCKYTSSNSANFIFDNLYLGPIYYDTIPPNILEIYVLDSTRIDILFSEEIDIQNINLQQFEIDNPNLQSAIFFSYTNSILSLIFPTSFQNNQISFLNLGPIQDFDGNSNSIDTNIILLYNESVQLHDLELTEIMSDPSPSFGLPICEYVEIQNTSNKIINLTGLFIADLSDTLRIDTSIFTHPNDIILICDETCLDSFPGIKRIGIDLPVINNATDRISLLKIDSSLIDSIRFDANWHVSIKQDGGYSLEKAELGYFCGSENWLSAGDTIGGSPGILNSVLNSPSNHALSVESVEIIDENLILINLSKQVDFSGSNPQVNCSHQISNTYFISDQIQLDIGPQIYGGDMVQIEIQNLEDCFGNNLDTIINIIAPIQALNGDLIINEILFDPTSSGTDYIELYNASDFPINLKNYSLANFDDSISNQKIITEESFILLSQQYCLVSKDSIWVKNVFKTEITTNYLEISSLPTYANDHGEVYLLNSENVSIDHVIYDVNMHYPLLTDFENKALERISFFGSSLDRNNWNTASGNMNYGTPGYQNSQSIEMETSLDFEVFPELFTPNNDGKEDNLQIHIKSMGPGIYSVYIFNLEGQLMNKILDGAYLSKEINLFWNGKKENQQICNSGIYIIQLNFISEEGSKKAKRKTAYLKL